jgi:predicted DNA-binding transcriptional regulator AlpA
MKLQIIRADNEKKTEDRQYLTSWKEIAAYMGCAVRTVQRYEHQSGLPVRRPTGKSRGSVIATRAEIDAWIAAAPIRETFTLTRVKDSQARAQAQADRLESGVDAMRKLKDQMLALRSETRAALNLLIDRVSAAHLLLPPARSHGYEPLVNMDMDMDMDMDMKGRLHLDRGQGSGIQLNSAAHGATRKSVGRKQSISPDSAAPKTH